jgi:hypothetical protein
MDKRLAKRHKREVARAKEKRKLSEPDVRTPEQIEAARKASRPDTKRDTSSGVQVTSRSFRSNAATSTGSAAKTSV